jgi:hypothetical protein
MTVIGGTDVTEHLRALIDQAPPLSAAQRDQLAAIFRPPIPRPRTPKTPMAGSRHPATAHTPAIRSVLDDDHGTEQLAS